MTEPAGTTTRTDGAASGPGRVERDTMGEVLVPASALYAAQTQRAVENFPISGVRIEREVVAALVAVKAAAARTNVRLGVVAEDVGAAVVAAAEEVSARLARDEWGDQFPVDVFQTGSGTSTNMNVNEVLATLASRHLGRRVHPNDEVNASQSSNDTFPTAVHLAAASAVIGLLRPALEHLATTFEARAADCADVVKSGRTHLMDATPVTLGQELGGYAAMARRGVERLDGALPRVLEVPLGGTAVGTGINTPPGFTAGVLQNLRSTTGLEVREARDHFEAQGARDALVELSGVLRTIAVGLTKACNDLRWMGSGPMAGLAEIRLPDLQPGSSIMPGKVNPVVPEAVLQVCAQVVGHDATVAWAGAAGNFELNVMVPVMSRAVLESVRTLASAARLLADRCVAGLEPDVARSRTLAESSPSIVTPLNRAVGYETAAQIAKYAVRERTTVREAAVALGVLDHLTEAELDRLLDVTTMTGPARH